MSAPQPAPHEARRQALVEEHAERGYRTQRLDRATASPEIAALLVGLTSPAAEPAREERGAA